MTADEALAIVEVALDYQPLNKTQELVFRETWEGKSYQQIAAKTDYEYDYIKDTASKLWKRLSRAFDEKVKLGNIKSVIKRYSHRHPINSQRNIVIEVNLNGANLSGANVTAARVLANFLETTETLSQADTNKSIAPTPSSTPEKFTWNGLQFNSKAEVKIAETLDNFHILFCTRSNLPLTLPYFLISHQGKQGILIISDEPVNDTETQQKLQTYGILIIKNYSSNQCVEKSDHIIQQFLQLFL